MTYTKMKQAVNRSAIRLKDFVFNLDTALIRNTDEQMYYIDRTVFSGTTDAEKDVTSQELPFQPDECNLK